MKNSVLFVSFEALKWGRNFVVTNLVTVPDKKPLFLWVFNVRKTERITVKKTTGDKERQPIVKKKQQFCFRPFFQVVSLFY
jgi:hypothetical protein